MLIAHRIRIPEYRAGDMVVVAFRHHKIVRSKAVESSAVWLDCNRAIRAAELDPLPDLEVHAVHLFLQVVRPCAAVYLDRCGQHRQPGHLRAYRLCEIDGPDPVFLIQPRRLSGIHVCALRNQ